MRSAVIAAVPREAGDFLLAAIRSVYPRKEALSSAAKRFDAEPLTLAFGSMYCMLRLNARFGKADSVLAKTRLHALAIFALDIVLRGALGETPAAAEAVRTRKKACNH